MHSLDLKGLYLPKFLDMMSLEDLLNKKAILEGIRADIELASVRLVEHREPIPNSLKIIKVLLKALKAPAPTNLRKLVPNLAVWLSSDLLQDEDTRFFAQPVIPKEQPRPIPVEADVVPPFSPGDPTSVIQYGKKRWRPNPLYVRVHSAMKGLDYEIRG